LWSCSVPLWKQYLLSYYWGATTLTTQALAGLATPKNATELTFAIVCMVCTMTIYAYIIGALRFGMLLRSLHVFAVACAQDCACEPQLEANLHVSRCNTSIQRPPAATESAPMLQVSSPIW
jgi:hypothetical protein